MDSVYAQFIVNTINFYKSFTLSQLRDFTIGALPQTPRFIAFVSKGQYTINTTLKIKVVR